MKIPAKSIQLKNGKTILLRSATADDAEGMLVHLRKSSLESYQNLGSSPERWANMSVDDEAKILGTMESAKNQFMLIALNNEKIVAGLGLKGAELEFSRHSASFGMSVQKAFQNSGLGTALIEYAFERAKAFGFHRLDMTVRTYNTAGIALYEKMGFERIGLHKHAALIDGKYVDEYAYQILL
jgi:RimJ/RimL family protein N-acetyltransferase